jgi:hypothetical protein
MTVASWAEWMLHELQDQKRSIEKLQNSVERLRDLQTRSEPPGLLGTFPQQERRGSS